MPYKIFKEIYSKVPRLCVDLIIKTKQGIIMSKRNISPEKGKWHFPGGTVLFGEKLRQTIKRVADEETGLKLKVLKIIGAVEYQPPSVHGHVISLAFWCEPISGQLRGSQQGKEIKYFKSIPTDTIKEQVVFLEKHKIL
ncbi:hypothetical protein A2630_01025 [Candidatus Woesebacteria bacterium RIFCSPHIGHO2_01_FULL_44_10]|uniref:Nudix hydrolase domain-containing protein n=1 Tax=Candidatus Woesebacteria bacterium RIFCSPLOWO2_01_FULL_44_14 TaxID=1802525 RepID=A0A1F8C1Z0_9BACT|nr:MAG: hypothetical protein A2630_01025 [Candidatus Woesebacteria bacterium RIFCSPHIGHO2_01_FULL_44_10]OGM54125.1 MAG: hypothetical protein A3F62_05470 [Candidatus Woesebacteria bacterium RIFCSPHIGHO2_12_FULL_44_11]OGM70357.1 MAG: hypothetical protein A2975_03950 [Candidatus Woesebacteria bacterium RIFCSPLOWO2_01_FULL_44_14]